MNNPPQPPDSNYRTRFDRGDQLDTRHSTGIDRRGFIKATGLSAVVGGVFSQLPCFAFAEDMTPQQRAKRLAELMDERRLFDRGTRRVYRGEHLTGVSLPVGGIAAGPIQINGEARRHIWQIFRNYLAVTLPNSFFAVCVRRRATRCRW